MPAGDLAVVFAAAASMRAWIVRRSVSPVASPLGATGSVGSDPVLGSLTVLVCVPANGAFANVAV